MKKINESASFGKFLIVWTGQLASSLGSGMTAFALGVHVFRATESASGFALVILCLFVPSIILRPVGGVLADRFDRRYMIFLGDAGSALAVFYLLFSMSGGAVELWKIYFTVASNSAFTALQGPSYKASLTNLLKEEQYSRGSALMQLASSAQHLVSPAAAGIILSAGRIETILIIDIATFMAAAAAVITLGRPLKGEVSGGKSSFFASLREGWIALVSGKGILQVVLVMSLVTFFIGFLQVLFAPMMLSFTDERTLGIVQSTSASGMLLGSILLGAFCIKKNHANILVTSLFLSGIFLSIMGLTKNIPFITVSFFMLFFTLPIIKTTAEVLIRKSIPNSRQGRAWGIIGVISQAGYIIAYVTSGILADNFFTPLFMKEGFLAATAGRLFGTGDGRGIGFMLFLSGISITLSAALAGSKWVRNSPGIDYDLPLSEKEAGSNVYR